MTFETLTIENLTKSFDKQHFANNHIFLELERKNHSSYRT